MGTRIKSVFFKLDLPTDILATWVYIIQFSAKYFLCEDPILLQAGLGLFNINGCRTGLLSRFQYGYTQLTTTVIAIAAISGHGQEMVVPKVKLALCTFTKGILNSERTVCISYFLQNFQVETKSLFNTKISQTSFYQTAKSTA